MKCPKVKTRGIAKAANICATDWPNRPTSRSRSVRLIRTLLASSRLVRLVRLAIITKILLTDLELELADLTDLTGLTDLNDLDLEQVGQTASRSG